MLAEGRVCNRLLGKVDGYYEIKCPRCKALTDNLTSKETKRQ